MTNCSDTNATLSNGENGDATKVESDLRGVAAVGTFNGKEVVEVLPHDSSPGASRSRGADWGRAVIRHPLLAVWGRVIVRSCGLAALLVFVAYLGHVSRDFDRFGGIRSVDRALGQVLENAERRGGVDAEPSQGDGRGGNAALEPDAGPLLNRTPVATATGGEESKSGSKGCPEETPAAVGVLPDGRVILNEANERELTTLPGIGPSRASSIVALRERLGRFRKVTDLLRVKGIGYKSLQKLKARVVVDRPPPPEPPAESPSHGEQEGPSQLAAHAGL